jgi:hypothetical protein
MRKTVRPVDNNHVTLLLFLLSASAAIPCVAQIDPAQDNRENATAAIRAFTGKIGKTYSFPFGNGNIALPGSASVESGGFLDPSMFPRAAYCGHCHQQAYSEWRHSLHANSFRTRFYSASEDILISSKGIAASKYCDRCHNPLGVCVPVVVFWDLRGNSFKPSSTNTHGGVS